MGWLALAIALVLVALLVVWPLTRGRRFFTPDVTARAEDVANQIYAGRPDDGFDGAPFDPVARGPKIPADPGEQRREG